MKYFKLNNNRFGLKKIPNEFFLINDYSGLKGKTHLTIKESIKNEFELVLINGRPLVDNYFTNYAFNAISATDIQEMSLEKFNKLKIFI